MPPYARSLVASRFSSALAFGLCGGFLSVCGRQARTRSSHEVELKVNNAVRSGGGRLRALPWPISYRFAQNNEPAVSSDGTGRLRVPRGFLWSIGWPSDTAEENEVSIAFVFVAEIDVAFSGAVRVRPGYSTS